MATVCIRHLMVLNTLCQINVVALRRVQLGDGWVTVFGQVNHLDI